MFLKKKGVFEKSCDALLEIKHKDIIKLKERVTNIITPQQTIFKE